MAKKFIAYARSGFGLSFLSTKKAETMHRSFAILLSWEETSALLKKVLTKLKPLSTFLMKSLFELYQFIQSTSPGEEALRTKIKANSLELYCKCWGCHSEQLPQR